MSLRVQIDKGDTHVRVCPGCLHPLEWFEYREAFRAGIKRTQTQKTEERPHCGNGHGWVTWWRILHVPTGKMSGFAILTRGGRLHKRLVPLARVLTHMRRSLKLRKGMDRDSVLKMRNRHRGVIVKDSRQMDLFGGVE